MMTSPSSYILQMQEAMAQAGLPADHLVADGKFHRFSVPTDKPGCKSGWYVFNHTQYPFGAFGSFKGAGSKYVWRPEFTQELCDEERLELALMVKSMRETIRKKTALINDETAAECQDIWRKGTDALTHPYLEQKEVPSFGLRTLGSTLLIPVCTIYGELRSLQFIFPDRANGGFAKRFKSGGQTQGCGYLIGEVEPTGTNAIAEGYATAASVYAEMNVKSVFAAFYCRNLPPAGLAMREAYPYADILFAADNDRFTPGNPGLSKALYAAERTKGRVTFPRFPAGCSGTDFNDLANALKRI